MTDGRAIGPAEEVSVALVLQVMAEDEGDADSSARMLRAELMALDVQSVEPLKDEDVPDRAMGLGTLLGWLGVQLGTMDSLRTVIDMLRGWAVRNKRTVEIDLNGDILKITGISSAQQDRIIEEFLARHRADD